MHAPPPSGRLVLDNLGGAAIADAAFRAVLPAEATWWAVVNPVGHPMQVYLRADGASGTAICLTVAANSVSAALPGVGPGMWVAATWTASPAVPRAGWLVYCTE